MKKIVLIFSVLAVCFASCGGNKKQESTGVDNPPLQSLQAVEATISDEHNAKNSLDYQGTYKGTLPSASGSGMKVTIELNDSTYVRTMVYSQAKKDQFVNKGKYVWNDAGSIVTLLDAEPANMYFVGENVLFALDLEGKKIEGPLADQYKLYKVTEGNNPPLQSLQAVEENL